MNYAKIITYDAANCHGYSITMWVSGCPHHCEKCFNYQMWDKNYGKNFDNKAKQELFKNLSLPHISNFVLLGGEPFSPEKREEVISLLSEIKNNFPKLNVIVYSGYTFEELQLSIEESKGIDYIIDGRFKINEMPEKPQLRGSTNQKCYKNNNGVWSDITEEYFN